MGPESSQSIKVPHHLANANVLVERSLSSAFSCQLQQAPQKLQVVAAARSRPSQTVI